MCTSPPTAFPSAFPRCARGLSRKNASKPSTSADTAFPPMCVLTAGASRTLSAAGHPALHRPLRRSRASWHGRCRGDHHPRSPARAIRPFPSSPGFGFHSGTPRAHAQQIGETLKADLVLTGSLRALPAHFRLRAEMILVQDGTQIWVEDLLVDRSRFAGLESELVNRLTFRLFTTGVPGLRLSGFPFPGSGALALSRKRRSAAATRHAPQCSAAHREHSVPVVTGVARWRHVHQRCR